jgi:polysaccharide pyruvyl transferase WcaK-like protein
LDYVAQTELSDIVISRNNDLSGVAWDMIHMAYAEKDSDKVSAHIKKHIKCFFSVDEWVAFMTTKDFSFGTRLHGTIAALLAGKPAMLVTHDTRTREMARWAAIPCIDESEVLRKTEIDFQGIYDDLDFSEFNERQKSYYSEFCEFFDENEIDHNLCRSVTAS